jgi:hypothetical protein
MWSPTWDFNPVPPEYEAGVLTTYHGLRLGDAAAVNELWRICVHIHIVRSAHKLVDITEHCSSDCSLSWIGNNFKENKYKHLALLAWNGFFHLFEGLCYVIKTQKLITFSLFLVDSGCKPMCNFVLTFRLLEQRIYIESVTERCGQTLCTSSAYQKKRKYTYRFPSRRPGFKPGSGQLGFVVDKMALGQVFSEYFGFPCQPSFHQLLHNHPH